jgi:hypothetical protein
MRGTGGPDDEPWPRSEETEGKEGTGAGGAGPRQAGKARWCGGGGAWPLVLGGVAVGDARLIIPPM